LESRKKKAMSNEEGEPIQVENMTVGTYITDHSGKPIPVEVTLTYPTGNGFAALAAMADLAEKGLHQLYHELLKHGDASAQVMEGKMILEDLARGGRDIKGMGDAHHG
jgi:hypothetical protein